MAGESSWGEGGEREDRQDGGDPRGRREPGNVSGDVVGAAVPDGGDRGGVWGDAGGGASGGGGARGPGTSAQRVVVCAVSAVDLSGWGAGAWGAGRWGAVSVWTGASGGIQAGRRAGGRGEGAYISDGTALEIADGRRDERDGGRGVGSGRADGGDGEVVGGWDSYDREAGAAIEVAGAEGGAGAECRESGAGCADAGVDGATQGGVRWGTSSSLGRSRSRGRCTSSWGCRWERRSRRIG